MINENNRPIKLCSHFWNIAVEVNNVTEVLCWMFLCKSLMWICNIFQIHLFMLTQYSALFNFVCVLLCVVQLCDLIFSEIIISDVELVNLLMCGDRVALV